MTRKKPTSRRHRLITCQLGPLRGGCDCTENSHFSCKIHIHNSSVQPTSELLIELQQNLAHSPLTHLFLYICIAQSHFCRFPGTSRRRGKQNIKLQHTAKKRKRNLIGNSSDFSSKLLTRHSSVISLYSRHCIFLLDQQEKSRKSTLTGAIPSTPTPSTSRYEKFHSVAVVVEVQ